MPELPEVEVMAQKLQGWIDGSTVLKCAILRNPGGRYDGMEEAVGGTSLGVFRRGKQLFFKLDNLSHMYDPYYVICHNAMSGYWDTEDEPWTFDYVEGKRESTEKDVRVKVKLSNDRVLRFHDSRLFGRITSVSESKGNEMLKGLGPEAITAPRMFPKAPVLNVFDMAVIVGSSKRSIKELITDQKLLAGVGNIYAAEALWLAGVHPERIGVSLTTSEVAAITDCIQDVLVNALGRNLDYSELRVYRKEKCAFCEGPIEKVEIAKRSTYLCPKCQPKDIR